MKVPFPTAVFLFTGILVTGIAGAEGEHYEALTRAGIRAG